MDAANNGNTLSYLALGDSYTIGESVPEGGRWPVQLARALRDEGVTLGDPRIIAATGWTTDELEWGIDSVPDLGKFDFVSLLIGVNNQYRNRSAVAYGGEFHTLLRAGCARRKAWRSSTSRRCRANTARKRRCWPRTACIHPLRCTRCGRRRHCRSRARC